MVKEESKRTPEEKHRRQTWLEIWLPLLVGIILCMLVVVLVILAAVRGSSTLSQASAISLILMIIPTLIGAIFYIALIIFLDYWLIKGNRAIPAFGKNIRQKVDTITGRIQHSLLSIVSFFVTIDTGIAYIKKSFSRLKR